mmetsp:Transcript_46919/g.147128  ORF Transcript_46919/g.147128 Transcript_46919/m.147128 type:complete len:345 (-) Transcript_46919:563-1597(-)
MDEARRPPQDGGGRPGRLRERHHEPGRLLQGEALRLSASGTWRRQPEPWRRWPSARGWRGRPRPWPRPTQKPRSAAGPRRRPSAGGSRRRRSVGGRRRSGLRRRRSGDGGRRRPGRRLRRRGRDSRRRPSGGRGKGRRRGFWLQRGLPQRLSGSGRKRLRELRPRPGLPRRPTGWPGPWRKPEQRQSGGGRRPRRRRWPLRRSVGGRWRTWMPGPLLRSRAYAKRRRRWRSSRKIRPTSQRSQASPIPRRGWPATTWQRRCKSRRSRGGRWMRSRALEPQALQTSCGGIARTPRTGHSPRRVLAGLRTSQGAWQGRVSTLRARPPRSSCPRGRTLLAGISRRWA